MTDTDEAAAAAAERDFQRGKVIFEQDCQEFRSLNGFLWQIPVIVSTLTGGWFGAGKIDDRFVQAALFLLAGCANLCFVVVLWRLRRGVMEPLLGGSPNTRAGRETLGCLRQERREVLRQLLRCRTWARPLPSRWSIRPPVGRLALISSSSLISRGCRRRHIWNNCRMHELGLKPSPL
ncbi:MULTISPECIES: hypothetical protein [unclassified Bradyrhizobium]